MKKIIFSFLALSFVFTMNAQVDNFTPLFGHDTQWTINEQFELVFAGVVAPAPAAAIVTTLEGLVSDGIGGNDFTGLHITFDGFIIDAGTSTKVLLAFDGTWGGKAVILEFSQWLCQANTDFGAQTWMVPNPPSDYQAAVVKNGYNKFDITVSATGLITCIVNGYVCIPFQADLASLKPTAVSEFFVGFANDITGFKMKNLVATKGGVTNKYLYDPAAAGIDKTEQINLSVFPNPSKGKFTVNNESVGNKYQITNILGQQVMRGIINSKAEKLDLTSQAPGTYMLVIEGKQGKAVKQIIKN